jgi:AcrR family transcriptional regulator
MRADKKRNQDRILRAAETLIAQRGADIPLEEIARAADVGSATVHRHFGDRRKLLDMVFRDRAEAIAEKADTLAGQGSAGWALAAWLRELYDWVGEVRGLTRTLATAPGDIRSDDTTCRDIVWAAGDQLLRRAQAEGAAPADVVMDELMSLILGVELAADANLLGDAKSAVLVERIIKSIAFGGAEPPVR